MAVTSVPSNAPAGVVPMAVTVPPQGAGDSITADPSLLVLLPPPLHPPAAAVASSAANNQRVTSVILFFAFDGCAVVDADVVAGAPAEPVDARPAVQPVVAVLAVQDVVAVFPEQT